MSDVIAVGGIQGPPGPPMPGLRLATTTSLPAYTATATHLTMNANGLLTMDGVPVVENTDVLIKNEGGGTSIYNRIVTVQEAGDVNTPAVLRFKQNIKYCAGFRVSVGLGSSNNKTAWVLVTDGVIVPGTTALTWEQQITAATPSGAAGGSLSGTYPNPGVVQLGSAGTNPSIVGGQKWTVLAKSAAYTITDGDCIILCQGYSARFPLTLPSAVTVGAGRRVVIIDADGNCSKYKIHVVSAGGLIGRSTYYDLFLDGQKQEFVSDGTKWCLEGGDLRALDPEQMAEISIATRFRADTGVTLVSSAVSDVAPKFNATGFGNHLVQATGGNRPTVASSWSNSEPAFLFTAASLQWLATTAWTGTPLAQPYTVYTVLGALDTTTRNAIDGIDASNRFSFIMNLSANTTTIFAGTSSTSYPNVSAGRKQVLACVASTDSAGNIAAEAVGSFYVNGLEMVARAGTAFTIGTQAPLGLTVGSNVTQVNYFNGHIAETMHCYGAHSAAQVRRITQFLMDWYGI